MVYTVSDYLGESLGVDAVSWRIKDDEIRSCFDLVKNLEDITCDEFAILKVVSCSVFFGCINCFFYYFNTDYLVGNRCNNLSYGSGSAIEVIDYLIARIFICVVIESVNIFSDCAVEYFGTKRISLEK